jgi:hypothetical protein
VQHCPIVWAFSDFEGVKRAAPGAGQGLAKTITHRLAALLTVILYSVKRDPLWQ